MPDNKPKPNVKAHAVLTSSPPASFAFARLGPNHQAIVVHPGEQAAFEYVPDHGPILAEYFEELARILRESPEQTREAIESLKKDGQIDADGHPTATFGRKVDDKDLN